MTREEYDKMRIDREKMDNFQQIENRKTKLQSLLLNFHLEGVDVHFKSNSSFTGDVFKLSAYNSDIIKKLIEAEFEKLADEQEKI